MFQFFVYAFLFVRIFWNEMTMIFWQMKESKLGKEEPEAAAFLTKLRHHILPLVNCITVNPP